MKSPGRWRRRMQRVPLRPRHHARRQHVWRAEAGGLRQQVREAVCGAPRSGREVQGEPWQPRPARKRVVQAATTWTGAYYTYTRNNVRFVVLDSTQLDPEAVAVAGDDAARRERGRGRSVTSIIRCIRTPRGMAPRSICVSSWSRSSCDTASTSSFPGTITSTSESSRRRASTTSSRAPAGQLRKGNIRPDDETAAYFDQDQSFMLVEVSDDDMFFSADLAGPAAPSTPASSIEPQRPISASSTRRAQRATDPASGRPVWRVRPMADESHAPIVNGDGARQRTAPVALRAPSISCCCRSAWLSRSPGPTSSAESYFTFSYAAAFAVNDIAMAFFFALMTKEVVEATAPGGVLHSWRRVLMPLVTSLGVALVPVADPPGPRRTAGRTDARRRVASNAGDRHRRLLSRRAAHLRALARRHPVCDPPGDCVRCDGLRRSRPRESQPGATLDRGPADPDGRHGWCGCVASHASALVLAVFAGPGRRWPGSRSTGSASTRHSRWSRSCRSCRTRRAIPVFSSMPRPTRKIRSANSRCSGDTRRRSHSSSSVSSTPACHCERSSRATLALPISGPRRQARRHRSRRCRCAGLPGFGCRMMSAGAS